ncbi:NUDIX hydrolase [Planctomycetaceae bacterium SH139]
MQALAPSIDDYLASYPDEAPRVLAMRQFLATHQGHDRIRRDNFQGHLTASAFLVDPNQRTVLMIKHRRLQRWLQPGGHIESSDLSLAAAACRELSEETGVPRDLMSDHASDDGSVPLDLDSHLIPASEKKQEPAHIHHDVRFLFLLTAKPNLQLQLEEVSDVRWLPLNELETLDGFAAVGNKIQRLV